jgi:hypothetical protein
MRAIDVSSALDKAISCSYIGSATVADTLGIFLSSFGRGIALPLLTTDFLM